MGLIRRTGLISKTKVMAFLSHSSFVSRFYTFPRKIKIKVFRKQDAVWGKVGRALRLPLTARWVEVTAHTCLHVPGFDQTPVTATPSPPIPNKYICPKTTFLLQ